MVNPKSGQVVKSSPLYQKLPAKTRKSYDAALRLASQYSLKDGRKFGMLLLSSITPGVADRLFARLKERPDGGERVRTAVLSVTVCKRAWNIARRDKPKIVPWINPFDKMELTYEPKPTRPVAHDELLRFVKASDGAGESWNHYRPFDSPHVARIFHHKTRELVDIPL